jgi:tetratricopeptide (TPR) repeat protein
MNVKIKLLCKDFGVILMANLLMGCVSQLAYENAIAQEDQLSHSSRPSFNSESFISSQQEDMYKILVAEIALRRGYLPLAAQSIFDVASRISDPAITERATTVALYAGQYHLATQAARQWVTIEPSSHKARQILGQMLLQQERTEEAVVQLEILLDSLKNKPEQQKSVMEAILKQPRNQKNQKLALELMRKLILKREHDPVLLFVYSRLLSQANQPSKALDVLRSLLTQVPDHAEAVPFYAYLLDKQEQKEQALQWMRQALYKYPDQSEWRLMYARMLADAEQFEDAIIEFEKLLSEYPEHGDILYALGVLSIQIDRLSAAKRYFLALHETGDRVNIARYYLGQIAQQNKDIENALHWYQLVKGGENYLKAQARVALLFVEQGELDKAIAHLHTVAVENEEEAIHLRQLEAELLMEEKRYTQAMTAYNQALKLKPGDLEVLYMRALLADKMNMMDLLEQDLRHILTQEPDNVNALNALGYSLADKTTRYEEAYTLIQKALDLSPTDQYHIFDSMGWVLYKLGDYVQAIAYLRKALAMQNDPEISAHLGEVLWVSGDQQGAIRLWNEALVIFPEDEKLLKTKHYFLEHWEENQNKEK